MDRGVRAAERDEAQIGEGFFPLWETGGVIGRGACLEN